MSNIKFNTPIIEVPKQLSIIDKKGKIKKVNVLTKANNIASKNKLKAIQLKPNDNNEIVIISKGRDINDKIKNVKLDNIKLIENIKPEKIEMKQVQKPKTAPISIIPDKKLIIKDYIKEINNLIDNYDNKDNKTNADLQFFNNEIRDNKFLDSNDKKMLNLYINLTLKKLIENININPPKQLDEFLKKYNIIDNKKIYYELDYNLNNFLNFLKENKKYDTIPMKRPGSRSLFNIAIDNLYLERSDEKAYKKTFKYYVDRVNERIKEVIENKI